MSAYVAPWNSPEDCDHQEWGEYTGEDSRCTHCCPCEECGAERAYDTVSDPDARKGPA